MKFLKQHILFYLKGLLCEIEFITFKNKNHGRVNPKITKHSRS